MQWRLRSVDMVLAPPPGGQQTFVSQKGLLQWPLKGRVAHSYGSQRSGSLRWEGWMIGAKSGDIRQCGSRWACDFLQLPARFWTINYSQPWRWLYDPLRPQSRVT